MGQIRGMKVRSSVKKLCDGCKVRSISPPFSFLGVKGEEGEDHCFLGGRLGLMRSWFLFHGRAERAEKRLRLYYL
jgi:hypothetical protein